MSRRDPLESSLEKTLREAVKLIGGQCLKLPADFYVGIPDRLLLLPNGKLIFVELKRSKGRIAPAQLHWNRLLRSLGYDARIVSGPVELQELTDEILRIK